MGEIIAFTGSHGTGKTTAADKMVNDLNLKYPDKSIVGLFDQDRSCPPELPINKETTPESQIFLFTIQMNKEIDLSSRFNIVVTDRTVLDVIAYTQAAGFEELAAAMWYLAEAYAPMYSKIIFKRIANNPYWKADGIRETSDPLYRELIEKLLFEYYEQLSLEADFSYA